MNFKIVAIALGVIAVLSVPVLVAANSSGSVAATQGSGAGTYVSAGDCTQSQLTLRDGSCGGDNAQDQVQTRTQDRLQAGDCTQAQSGTQECNQTQKRTQNQLGDQTRANAGDCTQEQLRTRACDQTCDGDQDQTRSQQRLQAGK
jgi:hypothetical protein